jgi:tripartite-type tricarboxylate transporter receptor subunit TctC
VAIHRRQFIQGTAGMLAAPAVVRSAWADTYPSRPVRIVCGFAAGSACALPCAAQALTDLIADRVQVMFDIVVSSLSFINAGKVRPIGVASATPQELLPKVPTIAQTVPGFEAAGWQGLYAPLKTPAEIINKSIAKLMVTWLTRTIARGWLSSAVHLRLGRQKISASSSRTRPKNGERSSTKRA